MEPAGRLEPQPWMLGAATRAVIAALTAGGTDVRFVGGCVRDAILKQPVRDIDIATPDPPENVIELLESAGVKAVPTGIAHGTVTAVTKGEHFEITTLREDVETFGRHARVAYTDDWMADAARRDLTMNAIFLAPDGTLYDPFGGLADLDARRIRFVGKAEQRIAEDVLRLLRFFRFFAYYGKGEPDPEAMEACQRLADRLPSLSAERVWSETRKLLLASDPAAAFRLMDEAGVLTHFLPEAHRFERLAALVAIELDIDEPTTARGEPVRRLAALVDDDGVLADRVAERLKFSNADRRRLAQIASQMNAFEPAIGTKGRRQLYALGQPLFVDLVLIHWAATRADGSEGDGRLHEAALDEAAQWTPKTLPVHGSDVLSLGVPHGPDVGALLAKIEDWWISGDFVADRTEALDELGRLVTNRPLS